MADEMGLEDELTPEQRKEYEAEMNRDFHEFGSGMPSRYEPVPKDPKGKKAAVAEIVLTLREFSRATEPSAETRRFVEKFRKRLAAERAIDAEILQSVHPSLEEQDLMQPPPGSDVEKMRFIG